MQLFQLADKDRDGELTARELLSYIQEYPDRIFSIPRIVVDDVISRLKALDDEISMSMSGNTHHRGMSIAEFLEFCNSPAEQDTLLDEAYGKDNESTLIEGGDGEMIDLDGMDDQNEKKQSFGPPGIAASDTTRAKTTKLRTRRATRMLRRRGTDGKTKVVESESVHRQERLPRATTGSSESFLVSDETKQIWDALEAEETAKKEEQERIRKEKEKKRKEELERKRLQEEKEAEAERKAKATEAKRKLVLKCAKSRFENAFNRIQSEFVTTRDLFRDLNNELSVWRKSTEGIASGKHRRESALLKLEKLCRSIDACNHTLEPQLKFQNRRLKSKSVLGILRSHLSEIEEDLKTEKKSDDEMENKGSYWNTRSNDNDDLWTLRYLTVVSEASKEDCAQIKTKLKKEIENLRATAKAEVLRFIEADLDDPDGSLGLGVVVTSKSKGELDRDLHNELNMRSTASENEVNNLREICKQRFAQVEQLVALDLAMRKKQKWLKEQVQAVGEMYAKSGGHSSLFNEFPSLGLDEFKSRNNEMTQKVPGTALVPKKNNRNAGFLKNDFKYNGNEDTQRMRSQNISDLVDEALDSTVTNNALASNFNNPSQQQAFRNKVRKEMVRRLRVVQEEAAKSTQAKWIEKLEAQETLRLGAEKKAVKVCENAVREQLESMQESAVVEIEDKIGFLTAETIKIRKKCAAQHLYSEKLEKKRMAILEKLPGGMTRIEKFCRNCDLLATLRKKVRKRISDGEMSGIEAAQFFLNVQAKMKPSIKSIRFVQTEIERLQRINNRRKALRKKKEDHDAWRAACERARTTPSPRRKNKSQLKKSAARKRSPPPPRATYYRHHFEDVRNDQSLSSAKRNKKKKNDQPNDDDQPNDGSSILQQQHQETLERQESLQPMLSRMKYALHEMRRIRGELKASRLDDTEVEEVKKEIEKADVGSGRLAAFRKHRSKINY
eukprot:g4477.t1